eukprot:symbB.v1.2.021197.t1/scaffold1819.1/size114121/6
MGGVCCSPLEEEEHEICVEEEEPSEQQPQTRFDSPSPIRDLPRPVFTYRPSTAPTFCQKGPMPRCQPFGKGIQRVEEREKELQDIRNECRKIRNDCKQMREDFEKAWERLEKEEAEFREKKRRATPLKVLGLDRGASTEDAKRAYKKLALQFHPDKNGKSEEFVKIQQAYEALCKSQ